ncbi:MAG TPA: cysteine hydrolase family protein [Ktedonobacteraceae bacterium]|nr:cysteine hydrolase family protein [Ktedonobacteraceae bacterium]
MIHVSHNAALVIIDVQKGFDDPIWGQRNNPEAEVNIASLLQSWRQTGRPIFHIQHLSQNANSPLRPGYSGNDIKDIVYPQDNEPVLQKKVNSAFIGTDLERRLVQQNINTLFITGLTTNHCVETTTRMAGNLGFHTFLVSDATATFDRKGPDGVLHTADEIQAMTLVNLHEEFATIITTIELLHMLQSNHTLDKSDGSIKFAS